MAKNENGLNPRQQLFADLYLADPERNATKAYKNAGYAAKGNAAEVNACNLLRSPKVDSYISERLNAIQEELQVTQEQVIAEYVKLGFSNMRDYAEFDEDGVKLKSSAKLTENQMAAVAEVAETANGIKFKLYDKRAALESMCRLLGWEKLHINMTGKVDHQHTHEVKEGMSFDAIQDRREKLDERGRMH